MGVIWRQLPWGSSGGSCHGGSSGGSCHGGHLVAAAMGVIWWQLPWGSSGSSCHGGHLVAAAMGVIWRQLPWGSSGGSCHVCVGLRIRKGMYPQLHVRVCVHVCPQLTSALSLCPSPALPEVVLDLPPVPQPCPYRRWYWIFPLCPSPALTAGGTGSSPCAPALPLPQVVLDLLSWVVVPQASTVGPKHVPAGTQRVCTTHEAAKRQGWG